MLDLNYSDILWLFKSTRQFINRVDHVLKRTSMSMYSSASVLYLLLFKALNLFTFPCTLDFFQQINGNASLGGLGLTSGDQARRSYQSMSPSRSNGVASVGLDNLGATAASPSQATSLTQPLETKTFPAQLANTLETFGRQLDVLTQVHIQFATDNFGKLYFNTDVHLKWKRPGMGFRETYGVYFYVITNGKIYLRTIFCET